MSNESKSANENALEKCEENLKKAGDILHGIASTDPEFVRVRNEYGRAQIEKAFNRFKNDANLYGQHEHADNLMLQFHNEIKSGIHSEGIKS